MDSHLFGWRFHCANNVPSLIEASAQTVIGHSGQSRRVHASHALTLVFYISVVALVSALLRRSGPLAVVWIVAFFIIHTLYRMNVRRAWPHIVVEVRKVIPSLAHGNATSAVSWIAGCFRVATSLMHVRPCHVFWRASQSVACDPFNKLLRREAAAGLCGAVSQVETVRLENSAAIAFAIPAGVPVSVAWSAAKNDHACKPKSSHVLDELRGHLFVPHIPVFAG